MEKKLILVALLIFIVKWTAVQSYHVPCPTPVPTTDEYGFQSSPNSELSVACYETSRKEMEKSFATEEDADKFIAKMPKGHESLLGNYYCADIHKIER